MTPRDPEIVIAEIIAAFERTKLIPCWGTWFTKHGEAVADGWDAAMGGRNYHDTTDDDDDDGHPVCDGCGSDACDYYAAGAAAAVAMWT